MASPIKTKITNLSDRRLVYELSTNGTVSLTPAGTKFDCTTIEGDIFSMFRSGRHAEPLILAVANGRVSVEYMIEAPYKVTPVHTRSMTMVGSMAKHYDPWFYSTLCNAVEVIEETKTEVEPPKEETKPEPPKEPEQEPVQDPEQPVDAPEVIEEPKEEPAQAQAEEPAEAAPAEEEIVKAEEVVEVIEEPVAEAPEPALENTQEEEPAVVAKPRTRSKRNIKNS